MDRTLDFLSLGIAFMLNGWLNISTLPAVLQASSPLVHSLFNGAVFVIFFVLLLGTAALFMTAKTHLTEHTKRAAYVAATSMLLMTVWMLMVFCWPTVSPQALGLVCSLLSISILLTIILFWPIVRNLVNPDIQRRLTTPKPLSESELRRLSLEAETVQRAAELEHAKAKLEQENDSANRMRQRMQSIFESAPNGMLVVQKDGTIAQANALAGSIFHYDAKEMVGMSVDQLVPKEHKGRHTQDRQHYVKSPTKRMMGDRKDLYGVCKDGHQVPVEIGLNPIEGSESQEIVATIVDISERKKYQRSIEMRNQALESSNRELQEFAFIASHDLREPLRKIISFSRLLQGDDYGQFTEEGRAYSGYVVEAAERMRNLLDSLLSYSRVTSKAKSFETTDLNRVIKDVCADLQLLIEESKAHVEVGELISLDADVSQIRQVFQNLVANAIKYCRAEQTPEIHISGELHGDYYQIRVADNGIGFESQYAEQIFEVFKRLHGRDAYPGTGMGLAICRKIILRHQGRIWAESHVNQGSVFYIELPVKKTKDDLFHV